MNMEKIILTNLLYDGEYARKTLPFLKDEYFHDLTEKTLFNKIKEFSDEYNNIPTKEILAIELDKDTKISEDLFSRMGPYLDDIVYEEKDKKWLLDNTEIFCKDKAIFNAVMKSINIIDGEDKELDVGALPDILSKALAVSFDRHIGHDFIENAEERFESYHEVLDRIPFDLEMMNKCTRNGFPRKTLNILLAGTNVGKSLAMCHMASANLLMGYNVLYITMEMAEERIAERIDANVMNVPLDDIKAMSKDMYMNKIDKLKNKKLGKLVIKEYPTASAGSGHFRHLMNELKLKKDFVPDIVYIDYLNICASSRIKNGSNVNSYTYIKAIAEELRGLAVEKNVAVVSATQLNREGFSNSDPELENTSESFALPATADWMAAMITSDELQSESKIMIKQLKSRYDDVNRYKRFSLGIDKSRMKLYDVDEGTRDKPVMDNTNFGERQTDESVPAFGGRKGKRDFSGMFKG